MAWPLGGVRTNGLQHIAPKNYSQLLWCLTKSILSVTMDTMDTKTSQMKIHANTRKKIKLLAAMRGMTMMDVVDQLVSEVLKAQEVNVKSHADSLQQKSKSG